jgi:hypothetical protein
MNDEESEPRLRLGDEMRYAFVFRDVEDVIPYKKSNISRVLRPKMLLFWGVKGKMQKPLDKPTKMCYNSRNVEKRRI